MNTILASLISLLLFTTNAIAQQNQGDDITEIGFLVGNILPNQIDGTDEIIPQWGLRYAQSIASDSFADFMVNMGNGSGVNWKQLSASVRLDMPVEDLVANIYLGADLTVYEGIGTAERYIGGGHFGGGLMSVVSRSLWVRADMKFNMNPGTSLFFNLGFIFRFGAGDDNQAPL